MSLSFGLTILGISMRTRKSKNNTLIDAKLIVGDGGTKIIKGDNDIYEFFAIIFHTRELR